MLIVKNSVVIGMSNGPVNIEDLTSRNELAVDLSGNIGDTYVNGVIITSLASLKAAKKYQIESERDAQIAQDVTVHGRTWDADKRSQENLSNEILTTQAGVQMSPIWRDADNNNMTLTDVQQLVDIAAAMKTLTLTAYMTSWVRKAAVDAATTAEEVALI